MTFTPAQKELFNKNIESLSNIPTLSCIIFLWFWKWNFI